MSARLVGTSPGPRLSIFFSSFVIHKVMVECSW